MGPTRASSTCPSTSRPKISPAAALRSTASTRQFSATLHANRVTTPILILHGEADLRVPTFQGREFFEALLARGKTTRLVTYPGSPHFPRLWEQRRDVFREIAAWLAKYNPWKVAQASRAPAYRLTRLLL